MFFYIKKKKYLIEKNEEKSQKVELILYNNNFKILDKLEGIYDKFDIIDISDNINNTFYDFVVYSINDKQIVNVLFYKIINSKFSLNYILQILDGSQYFSYRLNFLFLLEANLIIIIIEFRNYSETITRYKIYSYELIGNKLQKMNEISLTNTYREEEKHPRISFIYFPSYKAIFFNAYDSDNLYQLYNLKTYQIKFADNSILTKLKKISNKNEDMLLIYEKNINELKKFNVIQEKIYEYWKKSNSYLISKKKLINHYI